MTVTEERPGQGRLDLDGPAAPPDVQAVFDVLAWLEDRGDIRVHALPGPVAGRFVAHLRELGHRVAPLERLPTAAEPRGVPRAQREALTPAQEAVRDILTRYGPQADHELAALYAALLAGDGGRSELGWEIPAQSDSGLRYRRGELRDAGLVEDSGTKVATGRGTGRAIVWRIVHPEATP